MQIGNVSINGNVILAPMAGVTDLPFRLLCKEQGVDLIYTEMVSAKGIKYNNKNSNILLEFNKKERPVSLQLFGSDPDIMTETAKKIEDKEFDIFDINMGCPVPKIVNNGEGSALMKNPILIYKIIKKMTSSVKKPVTVKIRKGFNTINAIEVAKVIEEAGASAIAIHGRTREQYYSGKADWDIIKAVKEEIKIPVIGNGDIFTPIDAKNMLDYTKCDGIMIGRGAKGNPWIFSQIKHYLRTGKLLEKPSIDELIQMIIRHAKLQVDFKGEYLGVREMRKHTAWYTTGYPNSAKLRVKVNEIETIDELIKTLYEYKENIGR